MKAFSPAYCLKLYFRLPTSTVSSCVCHMYNVDRARMRMFRKGDRRQKRLKCRNFRHFHGQSLVSIRYFYNGNSPTSAPRFRLRRRSYRRKAFGSVYCSNLYFFCLPTSTASVRVCHMSNIDWAHRGMFRKGENSRKCRKWRNSRHFPGKSLDAFVRFRNDNFPTFCTMRPFF